MKRILILMMGFLFWGFLHAQTNDPLYIVSAADIPDEVEYITLYTQVGKTAVLYPYVIRFEDETGMSSYKKQSKKVFKKIRKQPVELIRFEGFDLASVGNMQDDAAAQTASAVVESHGLHDYGKRDTPVYYFKRVRK